MKTKRLLAVFFTMIICWSATAAFTQGTTGDTNINNSAETDDSGSDYKRYLTYGTVITSFALTYYYGAEAWGWGENDFKFGNEGWFGQETDSGGIDKVGHMWIHYALQRGFNNLFEWTLGNENEALLLSSFTAGGIGLAIELGDGTSSAWGFAYQDLIADWTGVALGALLEAYPKADAFIGFTWEYWPTETFLEESEGRKKAHVTSDYSGHKYMINFKLAGFTNLGWDMPEFLRYVSLDFGYYTRGYTDYEKLGAEKTRTLYTGISLNMMEVVKDFFEPENRESRLCKGLQQPFKYLHVPIGYNIEKTLRAH